MRSLGALRARLARIASTSKPEGPTLRLRMAGAHPGVHVCGAFVVSVVPVEQRRRELEQQQAEWERLAGRPYPREVERDLQSEIRVAGYLAADPATFARVGNQVLGMNSEARERMLAELDTKRTTKEVSNG